MNIASKLGMPIEALLHRLPLPAQSAIQGAVNKALEQCLRIAVKAHPVKSSMRFTSVPTLPLLPLLVPSAASLGYPVFGRTSGHDHRQCALHCGDCPQSGEDFSSPESGLACLEVFALGPQSTHPEAQESAYYATRAALAQVTREAVSYITKKGMAKESAPALLSFVGRIASRFGLEVSEKVAAELVPIAGAAGGLTLNILFSQHFQSLAEGHFMVRRLERKYGREAVRQDYELARPLRIKPNHFIGPRPQQTKNERVLYPPGCVTSLAPFGLHSPRTGEYLGGMTTQESKDERMALLQGTLDLLILKTLVLAPCHGQGVARLIQRQSEEVFLVDHGSLYVALQRLEDKKWIRAKWGVSENNRKARFYSLTPKGREHLVQKTGEWRRLTRAMGLILDSGNRLQGEEA